MKITYYKFLLPLLILLTFLTTYSSIDIIKSNYLVGITISGNVIRDGNGLLDNQISGTGTNNAGGIQLISYLVDANNIIIDKTSVLSGGSYDFNQVANGTYTVAISTNNVALGSSLAAIPANLPMGWNAVGESYGIGNSQTGFKMGNPNLQIPVIVSNSNKNIFAINFALDQSPVVTNDFFTTSIAKPIDIPVLSNDTDPNGNNTINKTTVTLIDPADNVKKYSVNIIGQGVYTVNSTTGEVNFKPVPTFIGVATKIKYTVKDDAGIESNEGVLSVFVKPVGVNDAGETPTDAPIITIVKANDGNSALGTTVSIAVPPVNGSAAVNPDGSITYTPVPNDKGTYTYTYLLTTIDGVTSDPITVTVAVGINPAIALLKTNVFNDTNGDGFAQVGETITYTFTVTNTGDVPVTATTITDPKLNLVNVALVPANLIPGKTGTLSSIYTITQADIDAGSISNTATTSALDPINLPVSDVSGTSNSNNTPTTIVINQNPSISLVKTSFYFDKDKNGQVNAGDIINYTFTLKNTGNVTLSAIKVNDVNVTVLGGPLNNFKPGGIDNSTFTATYTITQIDVDKGSVYNLASVNATTPISTVITGGSTNGNTVDPSTPIDPSCPNCTITTIIQKGSISLIKEVNNTGTGSNGAFILGDDIEYKFTVTNTGNLTLSNFVVNDPLLNNPRINIAGTLLPGQKNTIIATYKITAADNDLGKVNNQATITSTDINNKSYTDISGTTVNTDDITVTIVIKSPVAVDDNVQTKENRTINIDVLKNDIAFNSNLVPSSLIITRMPLYGTLIINSNGSVNYTPNPDYVGSDMFTYTVKDINGMTSNISTVNIAVGKSAPLAVDDSAKTVLNKNIRIDVIGNDIPDGSPLVLSTLKIISQPQHGTLSSNSDGSYTYMPNPDFAGNDEFTYNVEDGYGSISNTATVKIVVDGFFVPNVFTPNGDGVNDTFEIIGKDNYMAIEIEVYNRWGNQVYKNANYQNQWTGQGLNEGTYFYTLKLKSASNTELVKGWVLIKR